MPKTRSAVASKEESFRAVLSKPIELDVLLAKAGQKDRANVEKHLAALTSEHSAIWRRLTRAFATLAPLAFTTVGQQAIQFFIADGKYRMQVFALEDPQNAHIVAYVPDVLAEAVKHKIVVPAPADDQPDRYSITATKGQQALNIEQLTGGNTPNPGAHYKNMLGWNRKALRIALPVQAPAAQLEAVEDLAALAARAWANSIAAKPA